MEKKLYIGHQNNARNILDGTRLTVVVAQGLNGEATILVNVENVMTAYIINIENQEYALNILGEDLFNIKGGIIMETRALEVVSQNGVKIEEGAMSVDALLHQVALIQSAMSKAMKEGEHFGVIPGTNKPSLLKSGAEKLSMLFRIAPKYRIERVMSPNGHREYEVECDLYSINTGVFLGSGTGNCNTLEAKYRYRSENTGKPVPQEYWDSRDSDILGGRQFKAKKKDKRWLIFEQVEYDNPADYYNTVKKMAKKRAFVDAVLTVTAASDIFTQDVEDLPPEILGKESEKVIVEEPKTKEPEPESKKSDKKTTNFEFLKTVRDLKKQLDNDPQYYGTLGTLGFEHANEITDRKTQVKFFEQLQELVKIKEDSTAF